MSRSSITTSRCEGQTVGWLRKNLHWLLTAYVAFVFIQSLFFKFTGSPETVYIFQGKLDPWAASLGFAGVFAPGGHLFGQGGGQLRVAGLVAAH